MAERARLGQELLARRVVAWCGLSLVRSGTEPTWHDGASRTVLERLLADRSTR